jgi:hypothetical protein
MGHLFIRGAGCDLPEDLDLAFRKLILPAALAAADAAEGRHGTAGKPPVTEAGRATQSCCLIFLKRLAIPRPKYN